MATNFHLAPPPKTVDGVQKNLTETGQSVKLHFVRRSSETGQIVGGVAVQLNVRGSAKD